MSAERALSARRSAGETAYLSPGGVTPGLRLAAPIELTPQALRHTWSVCRPSWRRRASFRVWWAQVQHRNAVAPERGRMANQDAGRSTHAQLSSNLAIEWQFKSTTIVQPDNPNGFEWCINAPAIDGNGVVYANSEDGNVYALPQGHTGIFDMTSPDVHRIFLRVAIGAAYTPLSIAADGKLYTENDGFLFVIGN